MKMLNMICLPTRCILEENCTAHEKELATHCEYVPKEMVRLEALEYRTEAPTEFRRLEPIFFFCLQHDRETEHRNAKTPHEQDDDVDRKPRIPIVIKAVEPRCLKMAPIFIFLAVG